MRLIDADLLIKHLGEVQKTADEFGNRERFDDIAACIALVEAEKTIIYCGEIDHETFGKILCMDLRPEKWIPCKERLPDPEDTVLFCNQHGEVCIGCKFRTDGLAFIDYLTSNMTFATAWMPLPEPYEKEGDANE